MKYIRTKDGIYETIDYDQLPNNLKKQLDEREHSCMKDYKKMGVFVKMKQGALIISNIQPILLFAIQKQADTIEELCDEFVVIPLYDCPWSVAGISGVIKKGKHYEARREELDRYKGTVSKKTSELYAYIWGDNGDIIKVAKMNEKGVLCLI